MFLQSFRRSCSVVNCTKQSRENSLIRVTFEVGATLSIEWAPVTLALTLTLTLTSQEPAVDDTKRSAEAIVTDMINSLMG